MSCRVALLYQKFYLPKYFYKTTILKPFTLCTILNPMTTATTTMSTPTVTKDTVAMVSATTMISPIEKTKTFPQKRKTTSVSFHIINKPAPTDLTKRFNPVLPAPEQSFPSKKSTYFEKFDVATWLELDHGSFYLIDVQPGLRFPLRYIMYNICEEYPELTVKAHRT